MKENFHFLPCKTLISICIATYKREKLLEKLLISLTEQVLVPDILLEIVVVDNSSEGSAKNILQKFSKSENIDFKYFVQPEKNISLARNMCVQNSSGDFICFIDDDETASKKWVVSLYNALINFNVDGVFGYTEPIFDKNIPDYFKKRELYFTHGEKTGLTSQFYCTTNAIVKSDLIKSENLPFDPSYGLTGGEDAHLFERLSTKGAKFVDCKEAVTYEFIPHNRATNKYLFNRSLRGGQSFARRKLEQNNKLSFKLFILIKAMVMSIYSLIFYILGFNSKYNRISKLQILGAAFGKIRCILNKY